jgi:hypothetical protein
MTFSNPENKHLFDIAAHMGRQQNRFEKVTPRGIKNP